MITEKNLLLPSTLDSIDYRKASIEIPSADFSRLPSRRNRCLHLQFLRIISGENRLLTLESSQGLGQISVAISIGIIIDDSGVFVPQLPISNWYEVTGDPIVADAICDRIIHNAHRIDLKGDSARKIYTNN